MRVTNGGHAESYRLFDAYCIFTKTIGMRVDLIRQYREAGLRDDWKVGRRFSADAEFFAAAISNDNLPPVDESVTSECKHNTVQMSDSCQWKAYCILSGGRRGTGLAKKAA
jgi:hypothetical protein